MKPSWVYILRCADESYYTGCTTNIEKRISEHENGEFEGYTSSCRPVMLVWSEQFFDINDAIRCERQIKGWTRKKKEALIKGEVDLLPILAECKNDTHSKNLDNKIE